MASRIASSYVSNTSGPDSLRAGTRGPAARAGSSPRVRLLALLLALALSSASCAILSLGEGGHEGGSASLSNAAAAARDSTQGAPPLDVGVTTPPQTPDEVEIAPAPPPELPPPGTEPAGSPDLGPGADTPEGPAVPPAPAPPKPPEEPGPEHFLAGLVFGGGALGGHGYDGFATAGLAFGGYVTHRVRVDGIVSVGPVLFQEQSLLGQSFQNGADLSLDIMARYYLTGARTMLGLYPVAGVGTGTLFWDYAHPVPMVEDGEPRMAEDDRINHFSVFGGAGLSLLQSRYLHLGGNIVGGVRFYGWHTSNGFKNDMLPTTGFFRILLDANFHWGHTSW